MNLSVMQRALLDAKLVTKNRLKYLHKQEAKKREMDIKRRVELPKLEARLKCGISASERNQLLEKAKALRMEIKQFNSENE